MNAAKHLVIPGLVEIDRRIDLCRQELDALKRLRRTAQAAEDASRARAARGLGIPHQGEGEPCPIRRLEVDGVGRGQMMTTHPDAAAFEECLWGDGEAAPLPKVGYSH